MGVLPPIRPGELGSSPERSPYKATLLSLVRLYSTSVERISILKGLLEYRSELHRLGLQSGFQWLDGSFFEAVEVLEGRAPNDIDVVTYYRMPKGESQLSLCNKNASLFNNEYAKNKYKVDSYWKQLGTLLEDADCSQIAYWYSMWSHRRDGIWKGFVHVELEPVDDFLAIEYLESLMVGKSNEAN